MTNYHFNDNNISAIIQYCPRIISKVFHQSLSSKYQFLVVVNSFLYRELPISGLLLFQMYTHCSIPVIWSIVAPPTQYHFYDNVNLSQRNVKKQPCHTVQPPQRSLRGWRLSALSHPDCTVAVLHSNRIICWRHGDRGHLESAIPEAGTWRPRPPFSELTGDKNSSHLENVYQATPWNVVNAEVERQVAYHVRRWFPKRRDSSRTAACNSRDNSQRLIFIA